MSITLALAIIPQAVFFAVWFTAASPISLAYILIALAAFAMGPQANAIRSFDVPGISTTDLLRPGNRPCHMELIRPSGRRLTTAVVSLAVGGDWMTEMRALNDGACLPAEWF